MTVYSLLIFDRHTNCCFFHSFAGRLPAPGPSTLPAVYPPQAAPSPSPATPANRPLSSSSLPPWERQPPPPGSVVVAQQTGEGATGQEGEHPPPSEAARGGLAFDEEAKLVYGIIFSLRNMAKKLSGRDDDSFQSFSTSTYKLHYLHTATSYHFVLLTSPMPESLRFLLRQIHTGPFTDWVIRNPLVDLDSNNGKGIDNEQFRKSVEKLVLSINV